MSSAVVSPRIQLVSEINLAILYRNREIVLDSIAPLGYSRICLRVCYHISVNGVKSVLNLCNSLSLGRIIRAFAGIQSYYRRTGCRYKRQLNNAVSIDRVIVPRNLICFNFFSRIPIELHIYILCSASALDCVHYRNENSQTDELLCRIPLYALHYRESHRLGVKKSCRCIVALRILGLAVIHIYVIVCGKHLDCLVIAADITAFIVPQV